MKYERRERVRQTNVEIPKYNNRLLGYHCCYLLSSIYSRGMKTMNDQQDGSTTEGMIFLILWTVFWAGVIRVLTHPWKGIMPLWFEPILNIIFLCCGIGTISAMVLKWMDSKNA